ncbi:MAG: IPTL-CTERM sorting domain-containing protein, partial [Xanthomonadales bacterium]|nr:IPTL-CTERM sorting domain-containing protein [Xanthomonadales bacterium]
PAAAFPEGVTLESHVASAGAYNGTDWVVDLPAGASETLTMVATVGPTAAIGDDAISNTAAVSGSGGNETIINTGDDSATAFTSVRPTTASWTVSKDFLDDSNASITASLNCSSGEVTGPIQVSEGTPGVLTVERFLMGPFGTTSCEVTETLPPDYFPVSASVDCEVEGFVHEDEFNCDFVNAPTQATFHVTKDFSDDNPAAVRVVLECNTGLPLQQEAMISEFGAPFDHVDFIVGDFEPGQIDCDVFEAPVPGGYVQSYAASDNPGALYGNISDDENGCYFESVESGTFDCSITNTLLPVDVTVNKQWIDEHPEYQGFQAVNITLRCNNGDIDSGYDCGADECIEAFIDPNNPGVFAVFPDWDGTTSCSVTEEPDAGVLQDVGDCESIPLEPGLDGECTIVNTRLYAGIPTLDQYGLALLALLMLGMGLFAFRRFG